MARSLKKGPFVDLHLMKKIEEMNQKNDRRVCKTWSRRSTITPDFVGHTISVHNGKKFFPIFKFTQEGVSCNANDGFIFMWFVGNPPLFVQGV